MNKDKLELNTHYIFLNEKQKKRETIELIFKDYIESLETKGKSDDRHK